MDYCFTKTGKASIMYQYIRSERFLSITVWFISTFTQPVIDWLHQHGLFPTFFLFPLEGLRIATVLLHTRDQPITASISGLEALSSSLAPWKAFWSVPCSALWFREEISSGVRRRTASSMQKCPFFFKGRLFSDISLFSHLCNLLVGVRHYLQTRGIDLHGKQATFYPTGRYICWRFLIVSTRLIDWLGFFLAEYSIQL